MVIDVIIPGEVAEWSNAADLKSVVAATSPWVRIPPSPFQTWLQGFF